MLIAAALTGCGSQEINNPVYVQLNNIKNGVDIWSSINYQIITDKRLIREIEPTSTDEAFLVNILVKLANKGELRAESISTNFEASIPFKYTHGSGHEGTNHGYLDKSEDYEVYRYFTFKNQQDVEEFISKSSIKVEWKEKGETKQTYLKLPGKPTR
jgi:hypothetical protein